MKKFLLIAFLCLAFQFSNAQKSYTINGETLELKTEIDGTLDLLWTIIDGKYRYFIKTEDGNITELKNTRDTNKKYLEEYKTVLNNLTNNDTKKLKFRLYNLADFIDSYNAAEDTTYTSTIKRSKLRFRLGVFAGITNNPFVENPKNAKTPLIGGEIEVFEENKLPRHSSFLQARHTFDADDFNYSTNELALGYRYRVINKSTFSIYGQLKFVTLNFSGYTYETEAGNTENKNNTTFEVPFIFGVGSDIKVGKNSYITIIYSELFAAFLENNGNFSTDISVGYKLNL